MNPRKQNSLAHSIGEFFGHIWKAARTDPAKPMMRRTTVERKTSRIPEGELILRRTTIEEIELRTSPSGGGDQAANGDAGR